MFWRKSLFRERKKITEQKYVTFDIKKNCGNFFFRVKHPIAPPSPEKGAIKSIYKIIGHKWKK